MLNDYLLQERVIKKGAGRFSGNFTIYKLMTIKTHALSLLNYRKLRKRATCPSMLTKNLYIFY